jgi:hypothetical protein
VTPTRFGLLPLLAEVLGMAAIVAELTGEPQARR